MHATPAMVAFVTRERTNECGLECGDCSWLGEAKSGDSPDPLELFECAELFGSEGEEALLVTTFMS